MKVIYQMMIDAQWQIHQLHEENYFRQRLDKDISLFQQEKKIPFGCLVGDL